MDGSPVKKLVKTLASQKLAVILLLLLLLVILSAGTILELRTGAATADRVNARHRTEGSCGLLRVLVRGIERVRAVSPWYALERGLMRKLCPGYLTAVTA
jgi:hypothetical protein